MQGTLILYFSAISKKLMGAPTQNPESSNLELSGFCVGAPTNFFKIALKHKIKVPCMLHNVYYFDYFNRLSTIK